MWLTSGEIEAVKKHLVKLWPRYCVIERRLVRGLVEEVYERRGILVSISEAGTENRVEGKAEDLVRH